MMYKCLQMCIYNILFKILSQLIFNNKARRHRAKLKSQSLIKSKLSIYLKNHLIYTSILL
ncbi:MAG: hypothetical protein RLZZ546_484 [Bacteroidota bacterium]